MSGNIIDLNTENFSSTTSQEKPVLVDFWAPWCGPCKAIAPILEELATEMGDKVQICKVNVDNNQQIAAQYNIRAIPTMLIFHNGDLVDQVVGFAQKDVLMDKLSALARK